MNTIRKNTLVSISLRTEDERGHILEENEEVIYLHGAYGQMFQKLEDELDGKILGDTFNILLAPVEAFGEYKESLVEREALQELPKDLTLGMEFETENENGKIIWVVENIADGYATLNANHELAGVPVRISGEILELEQLSEEAAQEVLHMEDTH